MRKTLVAALVITAGLGGQAFAQSFIPKAGVITFALQNTYQAYDTTKNPGGWGVVTNRAGTSSVSNRGTDWLAAEVSYVQLEQCSGAVRYASKGPIAVNNATVIAALNAALSQTGGLLTMAPYIGKFNKTAKIIVINTDNSMQAAPYPPTMAIYLDEGVGTYQITPPKGRWNAPYDPLTYTAIPETWPQQQIVAWGRPAATDAGDFTWVGGTSGPLGARVFIKDPANVNANLRCFEVTPFFSFEESACHFCWDTEDRVSDAFLNGGLNITTVPPCYSGGATVTCPKQGHGITRLWLNIKFNNTQNNPVPQPYYNSLFTVSGQDTLIDANYGTILDPANKAISSASLLFTVGGIYTYNWALGVMQTYTLVSGKFTGSVNGYGQSPMCGHFSGAVTIVEVDAVAKLNGACWTDSDLPAPSPILTK
jgi:hypothetical protein